MIKREKGEKKETTEGIAQDTSGHVKTCTLKQRQAGGGCSVTNSTKNGPSLRFGASIPKKKNKKKT